MGTFRELLESASGYSLEDINKILDELSEEELDQFGWVLYYEFFTDDDTIDGDDIDIFEMDDVQEMIAELGEEMYEEILDLLEEEMDISEEQEDDSEELEEGVSRRMLSKNRNRKKRKFMSNSKAELRKTAVSRKRKNRQNKAKTKRYYKANKQKIASYQKSRRENIKKGKHKVKLRRKSG